MLMPCFIHTDELDPRMPSKSSSYEVGCISRELNAREEVETGEIRH